jgi:hypothetical protein
MTDLRTPPESGFWVALRLCASLLVCEGDPSTGRMSPTDWLAAHEVGPMMMAGDERSLRSIVVGSKAAYDVWLVRVDRPERLSGRRLREPCAR